MDTVQEHAFPLISNYVFAIAANSDLGLTEGGLLGVWGMCTPQAGRGSGGPPLEKI